SPTCQVILVFFFWLFPFHRCLPCLLGRVRSPMSAWGQDWSFSLTFLPCWLLPEGDWLQSSNGRSLCCSAVFGRARGAPRRSRRNQWSRMHRNNGGQLIGPSSRPANSPEGLGLALGAEVLQPPPLCMPKASNARLVCRCGLLAKNLAKSYFGVTHRV